MNSLAHGRQSVLRNTRTIITTSKSASAQNISNQSQVTKRAKKVKVRMPSFSCLQHKENNNES